MCTAEELNLLTLIILSVAGDNRMTRLNLFLLHLLTASSVLQLNFVKCHSSNRLSVVIDPNVGQVKFMFVFHSPDKICF